MFVRSMWFHSIYNMKNTEKYKKQFIFIQCIELK